MLLFPLDIFGVSSLMATNTVSITKERSNQRDHGGLGKKSIQQEASVMSIILLSSNRGKNVKTEVHLRTGNDVFWGRDEGAKVIPIWEGDNIEPDILNIAQNKIDASGYLKDVRTGYKLVD
jgi:hypothetical protein